jgi:hypothetical protein
VPNSAERTLNAYPSPRQVNESIPVSSVYCHLSNATNTTRATLLLRISQSWPLVENVDPALPQRSEQRPVRLIPSDSNYEEDSRNISFFH